MRRRVLGRHDLKISRLGSEGRRITNLGADNRERNHFEQQFRCREKG